MTRKNVLYFCLVVLLLLININMYILGSNKTKEKVSKAYVAGYIKGLEKTKKELKEEFAEEKHKARMEMYDYVLERLKNNN